MSIDPLEAARRNDATRSNAVETKTSGDEQLWCDKVAEGQRNFALAIAAQKYQGFPTVTEFGIVFQLKGKTVRRDARAGWKCLLKDDVRADDRRYVWMDTDGRFYTGEAIQCRKRLLSGITFPEVPTVSFTELADIKRSGESTFTFLTGGGRWTSRYEVERFIESALKAIAGKNPSRYS
jgi:hypothetical protein